MLKHYINWFFHKFNWIHYFIVKKRDMFTRQFFDLLLNSNENWKVSSVDDVDQLRTITYFYVIKFEQGKGIPSMG